MIEPKVVTGRFNRALVFANAVEKECEDQVCHILDHPAFRDSCIRIMPDVHVGKGTVVGFTATLTDKVVPAMIGVDIGCGVAAWNLGKGQLSAEKLDRFIRKTIPAGNAVHTEPPDKESIEAAYQSLPRTSSGLDFKAFWREIHRVCRDRNIKIGHVLCSLGTLGSGNHFIEIDKDQDRNMWLVIHSGSRNFGYKIAEYHQDIAIRTTGPDSTLKYLEGGKAQQYLEEMKLAQDYARLNRKLMGDTVCRKFFKNRETELEGLDTVHNYISFDDNIMRKGAISAHEGERVVIPFSMADGAVIGTGKGNREWNFSAPHGSGRKMSRKKARQSLDMDRYRSVMRGVWSSCIIRETLDESPMAYKKAADILNALEGTVEVEKRLIPLYNFKV